MGGCWHACVGIAHKIQGHKELRDATSKYDWYVDAIKEADTQHQAALQAVLLWGRLSLAEQDPPYGDSLAAMLAERGSPASDATAELRQTSTQEFIAAEANFKKALDQMLALELQLEKLTESFDSAKNAHTKAVTTHNAARNQTNEANMKRAEETMKAAEDALNKGKVDLRHQKRALFAESMLFLCEGRHAYLQKQLDVTERTLAVVRAAVEASKQPVQNQPQIAQPPRPSQPRLEAPPVPTDGIPNLFVDAAGMPTMPYRMIDPSGAERPVPPSTPVRAVPTKMIFYVNEQDSKIYAAATVAYTDGHPDNSHTLDHEGAHRPVQDGVPVFDSQSKELKVWQGAQLIPLPRGPSPSQAPAPVPRPSNASVTGPSAPPAKQ
eukprot:gnl/Spiro4/29531_TR14458_c0_g1_i1.p1 gnl/Spiro4/29531_TR14458_c0_g1~~gnl/Spiro4/29531_TR14458_c0_g1_i1.p1  ORF type:complete len:403 (+),score=108.48 gnl/Spiro4/29531_TR14458_c0_g1_i1:70-1209(+)